MKYEEIITIIEKINDEIEKKFYEEEHIVIENNLELELRCYGHGICTIYFLNNQIWCSEEDLREINVNGDYEPLEDFIRGKMNEIKEIISLIKI